MNRRSRNATVLGLVRSYRSDLNREMMSACGRASWAINNAGADMTLAISEQSPLNK